MGRIKDLTGEKFGNLTVIGRGENDSCNRCTWNCKCDCGKIINVKSSNLLKGQISCGCIRVTSLVGKRYGRLKVISKEENARTKSGRTHVMYLCKCDCGNEISVRAEALRSGNTKSCGCFVKDITKEKSTKHGLKNDRLYHVWNGMKQRCYNPNDERYIDYGGRGISVCPEWLHDFQAFYDWSMKNGCANNLTIDRIDNDKGYSPDNCRWVTNKEQQRNKRNNFIVSYKGGNITLSELSERTGINGSTLKSRLEKGMSVDEAVNFKKTELRVEFNGIDKSLKEWSARLGISYYTLVARYKKGLSADEILKKPK